jgi:hypothetical protein
MTQTRPAPAVPTDRELLDAIGDLHAAIVEVEQWTRDHDRERRSELLAWLSGCLPLASSSPVVATNAAARLRKEFLP